MLNKKLVLAALLGAALAQDPVDPADPSGTPDPTDPSGTTDPAGTADPKVVEDKDDDDEKLPTREWKEVMPDGSTDTVLCDQGESALWEDAKEKLVKLAAAKVATADAYVTAEADWSAANAKQITATQELATFNSEAEVYETALTDANTVVTTLQGEYGATITLSVVEANAALTAKTDLTATAQGKVTAQLARVEGLLTAQRTQELEEATWEERRKASEELNAALVTALSDANADVTMYAEQLTKRSYLFQMSGIGIWPANTANADYATGCAFGYSYSQNSGTNFDCYILEQAGADASVSVWDWSTCYSGNLPRVTQASGSTVCKHKGLDSDSDHSGTGLIADATARLGTSGAPAAGDLYKAFQDVNPHYHATDVKLTDHNVAITAYLAWQKKEILAQYLTVAAWVGQTGTSPNAQASDYGSGVIGWGSAQTDGSSTNWQPWINAGQVDESSTPYWYAKVAAAAVTARTAFDGWTPSSSTWVGGVALTPTKFQDAAKALVDVWHGNWILAALNAEKAIIGATTAAGLQATAATAATAATNAKTDNENNTAAMVRWKALAAAEVDAIEADVVRARALLVALTAEVSEVTRDEFAARADVDTATMAEAAKALAFEKLGTTESTTGAGDATGAYAVQAAAQEAANSITEQRRYHVARLAFYDAVLDPLMKKEASAKQAKDDAETAYDMGLALLNGLRDQCKKQAFTFAQDRLQKQKDAADLMADKITQVATDYADTAKFPAAPAIGALCNYPKGNEDPAAKRPDCGEDNCCGAAQRFLADGTKLSIETCQKPETTVYTYWPALPADALVAPTSETWRFQCISAAGRLATSVAAALATGYLLA